MFKLSISEFLNEREQEVMKILILIKIRPKAKAQTFMTEDTVVRSNFIKKMSAPTKRGCRRCQVDLCKIGIGFCRKVCIILGFS